MDRTLDIFAADPFFSGLKSSRAQPFFNVPELEMFSSLADELQQLEETKQEQNRLMNTLKQKLFTNLSSDNKEDPTSWQACLDVTGYRPDELKVSVNGRFVTVEGEHMTDTENHYKKMEFRRKFTLSDNVIVESLKTTLSPEGLMMLKADKRVITPSPQKTTNIPVKFTES